jgi:predicted transcriptional regulator
VPFEKGNKIGNRFKEGNNANPNGRRNAARDILNKILDTEVDERTKRERLLNKLVNMANQGNLNAMKEVLDRTEGRSTEYIVTEEVKPIRVLEFGDDILDEK